MHKAVGIALERPDQPEVIALIDALDAYQKPLYPAESHHGIDITALLQPQVLFAVVRDDGGLALGCGALVLNEPGNGGQAAWGEIKRMFVLPSCRGMGLAPRLLAFLEQAAQAKGCRHFALETGIHQHAAIALYHRAGYLRTGPFGSYQSDPYSVFMQKRLKPSN
jgi:GNAT superfamily N-acetyltransferase